jgi:hypothetical protein
MSNPIPAATITPFNVTGIEGHLDLRYFFDDYRSKSEGADEFFRRGSTFEERLYVLMHSYIYHPNFMRLDVGGGPVFFQNRFESSLQDDSYGDQFFDLDLRLNILEKKPYPLSLYYDEKHITTSPVSQDRLLLKSTRYGLDFALRRPAIPAEFRLNARNTRSQGVGATRVVDEDIDQVTLFLSGELGPNGDGSIRYSRTERRSATGSTALPVVPIDSTDDRWDVYTTHVFGDDEQITLYNRLTYNTRDNRPSREAWHYFPSLRWRHSETLNTFYRYDFVQRQQEDVETTAHRGIMGFNHLALDRRLQTDGDVHANANETDGFQEDSYGGRLALGYQQPLTEWMRLGLRGDWSYDFFDREARSDSIEVIGERIRLDDAVPVSLRQTNVVRESISVSNEARTQIYLEDLDYRVIVVDDVTQLQRLPTGNIQDGEVVLVDYSSLTGGTASFTTIGQSYRGDLTLYERLRLYLQYRDSRQSLQSGEPTLPLNSVQDTLVGAKLDVPFWDGYSAGGQVEHEDYDADVGPYIRDRIDVYFQMPVVWRGRLRLFANRTKTDRLDSPEDGDVTRYGARYNSRPWRRTDLSAEVERERDVGGTVPRENTRARLRLSWAYRKLRFDLTGYYNATRLSGSETDRARIEAILSRNF